jgi:enoyl-CoA hydratase
MSEVLLERPAPGVALLRLNRPEARNALNLTVRRMLGDHFRTLGTDVETRCIVLTGNAEVFAAGADIRDMVEATPVDLILRNTHLLWQAIAECPKPIIAAVNGYALGGGCELAMHADMIVAGESASFGQPEIRVGIMPGAGGTQRLTRAVGKFKAMKMVLTGQPVSARDADAMGLVTEVVPDAKVEDGPEAGGTDREDATACRPADQGSHAGRPGRAALRRFDAGTEGFSTVVRQQGPAGRHAGLPGKTETRL